MIVLFAITDKDPVLNMFFWFSGLAVVAIVLVEFLVCFAVMAYFRRHPHELSIWKTTIAPILAAIGLLVGEYLLMSRFGLLAGTVAEGVDPTAQSWGLNFLGYTLVFLPFIVFVLGTVVGTVRRRGENAVRCRRPRRVALHAFHPPDADDPQRELDPDLGPGPPGAGALGPGRRGLPGSTR